MFGPIESIAFDLDGTLVNTMESVAKGMQQAVQAVTGKFIPVPDLVKSFGPAPKGVLAQWVPPDVLEEAHQKWIDYELHLGSDTFQPFEGIPEMLADLKSLGLKMGVFTGRDRQGTMRILNRLGWTGKFFTEQNIVCGDDGYKSKPSGEGLIHLMNSLGWTPLRTLMVGDHKHDMMAGREAKCRTAVALWDQTFFHGATDKARFRESWNHWENEKTVDLRLPNPQALTAWFKKSKDA